jgi:acyl-CoA thioester hydrolase
MSGHALDIPYRGGFVDGEHHFALTVYFEDTDAYGIVYYANYLKVMERARSDMIRAAGVDQFAELAASGSAYAVVEVAIRYRRPGRLGDALQVISSVDQVRASSVDIQQRVMRGAELLTEATVTAAFLDRDGRPRRQPKSWVEKFMAIAAKGQ